MLVQWLCAYLSCAQHISPCGTLPHLKVAFFCLIPCKIGKVGEGEAWAAFLGSGHIPDAPYAYLSTSSIALVEGIVNQSEQSHDSFTELCSCFCIFELFAICQPCQRSWKLCNKHQRRHLQNSTHCTKAIGTMRSWSMLSQGKIVFPKKMAICVPALPRHRAPIGMPMQPKVSSRRHVEIILSFSNSEQN